MISTLKKGRRVSERASAVVRDRLGFGSTARALLFVAAVVWWSAAVLSSAVLEAGSLVEGVAMFVASGGVLSLFSLRRLGRPSGGSGILGLIAAGTIFRILGATAANRAGGR